MRVSVIVPTYRRPGDLARCLEALRWQQTAAAEIILVVRDSDDDTHTWLATSAPGDLPLRVVTVTAPGQVAALNAGLASAQGDILALTDDDAAPHPDWVARIRAHFASDPGLGGVGGRDWIYHGDQLADGRASIVGRLQWFGRAISNHHLGTGTPREADFLKGVNMSFRQIAIAGMGFDSRLRGSGAQVHNDMTFCLALRRAGWRLLYDPAVAVDHYPGRRIGEVGRATFSPAAYADAVHNYTLTMLEHLSPWRRACFLLWSLLVGTRAEAGVLRAALLLPREGATAARKWVAALRGRCAAWQTWRQTSRRLPPPVPRAAEQKTMAIKAAFKAFLRRALPGQYPVLQALWGRAFVFRFETRLGLQRIGRAIARRNGATVQQGPFAGMRYTAAALNAGHAGPKLLGSYERELHPAIEGLIRGGYDMVANIGCGEGYYAVGMAMRLAGARIVAFDLDPVARWLCAGMARANLVAERVAIEAACSPERLDQVLDSGGLVVCDCEGCEDDLLRPDRVPGLRRSALLVELHDHVCPDMAQRICARFASTHAITIIDSVERRPDDYPASAFLDPQARSLALCEFRAGPQQWAIMLPLHDHD